MQEYIEADFEIGHLLKEKVIPRAVMYFIGEYSDDLSSLDTTDSIRDVRNYCDSDEEAAPIEDSEDQELKEDEEDVVKTEPETDA